MGTPLQKVIDVIDTHKAFSTVYQGDMDLKYASTGVTQMSIVLGKDFSIEPIYDYGDVEEIDGESDSGVGDNMEDFLSIIGYSVSPDMTERETYLAGLYATRNFLFSEHEELTRKAVNFKTINFAVHGLTERAKEYMRMVWWIDNEIKHVVNQIQEASGSSSAMGSV